MKPAVLDNLSPGDVIVLDDGFTCTDQKEVVLIASETGELYFECSKGRHYLSGQLEENGELVGMLVKDTPTTHLEFYLSFQVRLNDENVSDAAKRNMIREILISNLDQITSNQNSPSGPVRCPDGEIIGVWDATADIGYPSDERS